MKKINKLLIAIILITSTNSFAQKFSSMFEGTIISAITTDKNNVAWVGTQKKGLYKIEDGETTQILEFDGIKEPDIWCLFVDSKNRLWVGTGSYKSYKGSGAFMLENGKWTSIKKGLPSSLVVGFYEDSKGDMWISSGKGVCKYINQQLEVISTDNMNRYFPRTVKEDQNNNIWVSECKGFYKYVDGKKEIIDIKPSWLAWDFEFQKDTIWIAMEGGFFKKVYSNQAVLFNIKGETLKKRHGKPPPGLATDLHIDSKGALWFSSYSNSNEGVAQYYNGNWIKHTISVDGAFRPRVIHEDSKGQIWICLQSYGVAKYSYETNSWKTYTVSDGLISEKAARIHIDNNDNVWVGTTEGLTKITP